MKLQNYPTLRFPEFNDSWKIITINELGEVITGNTPKTSQRELYNGTYLFVSPFDINNSRWIDSTKTTVSYEGFLTGRIIKKDSCLFVCIGSTIGKIGQARRDCISNQQINSVYSISNNNDFIYSLLEKHSSKIKLLAAEQAVPIINKTTFSNYKLCIPSLPEQQKIASFLTAVDEKIQALKKKKKLLEQYKKGVMQKLFSQELRFKDENGNDFLDWEEKKLGDYLEKCNEKSVSNNEFPILTSARTGLFFQKDYFDGQDVASKNNIGYNVVPKGYFTYRHMSDDLVFKFNINNLCDKGIVSTLYPVFKIIHANSEYIQLMLNEGKEFKNYAIMQKQGGSRTYMYYNKLEQLIINLPTLEEQNYITDYLSLLENKIKLCKLQIEKTETWKKGLLQKMFV